MSGTIEIAVWALSVTLFIVSFVRGRMRWCVAAIVVLTIAACSAAIV
ncbi:hypothetical protein [Burkholderia vietnamiensis]|nr:hypothetical protein [Burkholderia vietnamiensis]MCA8197271.1 hypothetical protein [Burkholderia vietnamiensis]